MKEVEEALARQVLYGADLVTNLLEVIGAEKEAALAYVLAEHYGLRPWPSGPLPEAPRELREKVSAELATRHLFAVIGTEPGKLLVATLEPLPEDVKAALEEATSTEIVEHAVPSIRIRQALARDHGVPLERRFTRLLARLDARPDPAPSTVPPTKGEAPRIAPPAALSPPIEVFTPSPFSTPSAIWNPPSTIAAAPAKGAASVAPPVRSPNSAAVDPSPSPPTAVSLMPALVSPTASSTTPSVTCFMEPSALIAPSGP